MPVPQKFGTDVQVDPISQNQAAPAKFGADVQIDASNGNASAPPEPGPLQSLANWGAKTFPTITPEQEQQEAPSLYGHGVDRFLTNATTSALRTLTGAPNAIADWATQSLTPQGSIRAIAERGNAPGTTLKPGQRPAEPTAENASDYASNLAGGVVAGSLLGEAGGSALRGAMAVPGTAKGIARALTGTGEGATGKFVADIAEKNKAAIGKAAEATEAARIKVNEQNTKQSSQHKTNVSKYLKSRNEAETAQVALADEFKKGSTQQAKIEPTQEKLVKSRKALQANIETAREKAKVLGDTKYNAVNEALNPIKANQDVYTNALMEASEGLKGSKSEPAFLKGMEKRIETGDPITYSDLQGDYSALGKELSKGTLPGDVYHAYDQIHEALGNEMQRIADSKGMGQQLTDARNYWRRMKQTFGKPFSMTDAATKTLSSAAPNLATDAEQANRIRLLGSFDPNIPSMFSDMENIQNGLKALPKPESERTRLRTLTEAHTATQPPKGTVIPRAPVELPAVPHEAPIQPELTRVTPQSISQQKANIAFRAAEPMHTGRIPKSAVGMAHYLQRNAMGLIADQRWGQNFINSLTNLTQADIDQAMRLPADQRSGFEAIVREARRRGIPVGAGAVVGGVAGALRPAGQGNQQ